jgi:hypothetical protein
LLLYEREIAEEEWGLRGGLDRGDKVGGLWILERGDDGFVSSRFKSLFVVSMPDDDM